MSLCRPETHQAFAQLINALDNETKELTRIGGEVAYNGAPENAVKVLRLAGSRAQLRDHIQHLHDSWQRENTAELNALTKPPPPENSEEPPQKPSPLSNKVKGLTIGEAAKKLMLMPKQIRAAIEAGHLVAYQKVNGEWKILPADLIDYHRKHVVRR